MLKRLNIANYAIIDHLEIVFTQGFNIITGETGAGKSILMGALGLILGDRADTKVLYDSTKKCYVEAEFVIDDNIFQCINQQENIEIEGREVTIRREIANNGKTRAFINDSPCNLQQLQLLGSYLVDLHRQFDTLSLNNQDNQRLLLDLFAGNKTIISQYESAFSAYQTTKTELNKLKANKQKSMEEEDFLRFQATELTEAKLLPDEIQQLEQEQSTLSNVESIKSLLAHIAVVCEANDGSAMYQVYEIMRETTNLSSTHPKVSEFRQRFETIISEFQDISRDASIVDDQIDADPQRLEEVSQRLSLLYGLLKKYKVDTIVLLIEKAQSIKAKLNTIDNYDQNISELEHRANSQLLQCKEIGGKISISRYNAAEQLSKEIRHTLAQISMVHAEIKVEFTDLDPPEITGLENINFLFRSNKGGNYLPIASIASGGEMSRVALAIKNSFATSARLATLVFDEIDSGVSGEVAARMANVMLSISSHLQVICITHSPQIAAKAQTHYLIHKEEDQHRAYTRMTRLDNDQKIHFIATMLSGTPPTTAAIQNARDLMNN